MVQRRTGLPDSKELPPYRGILAVDAKSYTALRSSVQQDVSTTIPKIVGRAFSKSGLSDAWQHPSFYGPTGDGFAIGISTSILPRLVYPFLDNLQDELMRHSMRSARDLPAIRLRVSLNLGPLPDEPSSLHLGGNGTERNNTHRLLDSIPIKAVLAAADAKITLVAAVVSDRLFQDVVVGGYAGLQPEHFIEVAASVPGKDFDQRAWIYIPAISGNLVDIGLSDARADIAEPAAQPASHSGRHDPSSPVVHAPRNSGQVAGVVYDGMHQGRV